MALRVVWRRAGASVIRTYAVTSGGVEALLTSVGSLFREAKGLQAESVRVGVRPIPPQRLPILRFAPALANIYLTGGYRRGRHREDPTWESRSGT